MVTMLEKAINYVQCLELQIQVSLSSLYLQKTCSLSLGYIFYAQSQDQQICKVLTTLESGGKHGIQNDEYNNCRLWRATMHDEYRTIQSVFVTMYSTCCKVPDLMMVKRSQ
jgi:hypothetical protein